MQNIQYNLNQQNNTILSQNQPQIISSQLIPEPLLTQKYQDLYQQNSLFKPYLKILRKKVFKLTQNQLKINQNLINYVYTIVIKFNFSYQTFAIGLYIYYQKIFPKISHSSNHLLYAAMCLYVAAKSIEKTSNIPTLLIFKGFTCCYLQTKQFTRVQSQILQLIDYKINMISYVSFINYYLSKGIIFENQSNLRINKNIVLQIQNNILAKVQSHLKNGNFLKYNQEELAIFILYKLRQQCNMNNPWNKFIEQYTGFSKQQAIQATSKILDSQKYLILKKDQSLNNLKQILIDSNKKNISNYLSNNKHQKKSLNTTYCQYATNKKLKQISSENYFTDHKIFQKYL